MKPAMPESRDDLRVGLSGLEFMAESEARDELFQIQIADDWFQSFIAAQKEHYRVHRLDFQAKLQTILSTRAEETTSTAELEATIGLKLAHDLRKSADELFDFVDRGIAKHDSVIEKTCKSMKKMFPDESFIRISIAESYFDDVGTRSNPQNASHPSQVSQ